ncbi:Ferric iron ABC transporter, permease protein [Richelia intracellularis]|nr:Ferric iron ABC transporter, permease protein [Richelia intracellularis]
MKAVHPPLFLTLAGAVVAVAIALPMVYLVTRTAGMGYEDLFALVSSSRYLSILGNSAIMAGLVTVFSTLIAIPLAFLTVRTDLPWRKFWLIVTTLPLAVPSYVGSFTLIATLAPKGSFLQILLAPLGVEELPSIYGLPGAVLAITLFTYPYMLISMRSGLQGIDPSLEEAARSLGYSRRETFLKVILPQLKPSAIAGGLLVALYALRDFGTPSLMRFDAFTRAIFIQYTASFNRNSAAALALMLLTLVLLILWLESRVRTRAAYYSRGSASLRPIPIIKLGIWKWVAVGFCTIIATLSVFLPVGITLFWLIRGLRTDYSFPNLLPIILNSVGVAALAAIFATVFALPIAILAVRFPSRITAIIERCSYIGFGVPGIVIALSLVFFGANYLPVLYQTFPMLLFAYLVLFLPQSLGNVRSSLLQINPQLEESARSLGRSSWQTITEVILPLVKPGIISGAVLVFLTTIKELPATMLLSPIGFDTLAVEIWQATESVDFADAAAASLTMLLVSMGSTLLILSQEKVKNKT